MNKTENKIVGFRFETEDQGPIFTCVRCQQMHVHSLPSKKFRTTIRIEDLSKEACECCAYCGLAFGGEGGLS